MFNQACMVCRQKNSNQYVDRLKRIDRLVRKYEYNRDNDSLAVNLENSFDLEIRRHTKCKYGMGNCSYLMSQYRQGRMLIEDVSGRIVTLVYSGNSYEISELLNICRGYFPNVYRLIDERLV